jgi:hypothetical protein
VTSDLFGCDPKDPKAVLASVRDPPRWRNGPGAQCAGGGRVHQMAPFGGPPDDQLHAHPRKPLLTLGPTRRPADSWRGRTWESPSRSSTRSAARRSTSLTRSPSPASPPPGPSQRCPRPLVSDCVSALVAFGDDCAKDGWITDTTDMGHGVSLQGVPTSPAGGEGGWARMCGKGTGMSVRGGKRVREPGRVGG